VGAAQHGNVVRAGLLPSSKLVLLHHKFRFDILLPIGAAQHGHRDKDLVMTMRVSRDREQGFQRIVSNDFRGS
jgi:hypothetical protein